MQPITIDDVLFVCVQVETGSTFNNTSIVLLKTTKGYIDTLFTSAGELIKQGESGDIVNAIIKEFDKQFKPLLFDNIYTWGHFYK